MKRKMEEDRSAWRFHVMGHDLYQIQRLGTAGCRSLDHCGDIVEDQCSDAELGSRSTDELQQFCLNGRALIMTMIIYSMLNVLCTSVVL